MHISSAPALRSTRRTILAWCIAFGLIGHAGAQETDITQAPNPIGAGIQRSYADQIGAGHGNVWVPDSAVYLIKRDPFRSIARGRELFQRKFTAAQGLGPRAGDGAA